MAQFSDQERTEQATPKRIKESREKGQIARSKELTTFSMLLASGIGILVLGNRVVHGLLTTLHNNLQLTKEDLIDPSKMPSYLIKEAINTLWVISPLLFILILVAIMAPIAMGGWAFSIEAIAFKYDRISPVNGIKRILSWKSIIELIKALCKLGLIAIVACIFMWKLRSELLVLGDEDISVSLGKSGDMLIWAFIALSSPLLLAVAIDVPFQLWDHAKQLRMTKQEVRDENKETEGNPEIKGRVRLMQRELARKRMMAEVPRADVIITNPTHYAVALKYDQTKMRAPVVVAKGLDLIALQIRSVGGIYNVPIVTLPALSRSIYHNTPLNKEIPAGLYVAVAQILAYVYQLKSKGKASQMNNINFENVNIPDDLRRDA